MGDSPLAQNQCYLGPCVFLWGLKHNVGKCWDELLYQTREAENGWNTPPHFLE